MASHTKYTHYSTSTTSPGTASAPSFPSQQSPVPIEYNSPQDDLYEPQPSVAGPSEYAWTNRPFTQEKRGDVGVSEHWSDEVSAAYATPYYAAVDHVQQDAPVVDPQACLFEYPPEQLVGDVSAGTSVTPGWTDNAGQHSEDAPLLTADDFVPQFPPCVAVGPVADAEFQPGTEHVPYYSAGQIDYSSQQGWRHCAPRIDNVAHVYGERTLQNSAAVSGARSEYFQFRSVRQDIPYTGYDHVGNQEPVTNIMPYRAAHHPGSTSSPVGYRVGEYAFGRQPEGFYHPWPINSYPSQPPNGIPLSGTRSEYPQFVRQEFPPSGQIDGTFAEDSRHYLGGQDTGPCFLPQAAYADNASEGAEELGPISCHAAPSQTDRTFSSYSALMEYPGGQDIRGLYLPQENVPYSDNGAPPYRGMSFSHDSGRTNHTDGGQNMPTITNRDLNYNQGVAWTTTATPPAANAASLEMVGSLAMQSYPVPSSPSPHPGPSNNVDGDGQHTETAQHSYRCRLDSGCGKTCGADVSVNGKRHFKSHLMRELRRIKNGSLDLSDAKIIKSEADLRRAEELKVPCPNGCTNYGVPTTYARKAHLRRHLEETCRKPLDDNEIDAVATKAFSRRGKTVAENMRFFNERLLAHVKL
ncbi:hypothetical protein JB92DRAFT_2988922 [Gautieria morchelliformis]|nr:hypothetical protein JB92DRAFT_2988922 [Gautieria morchelliformis]